MTGEEGYGEEGYTVIGSEHYSVERQHRGLSRVIAFVMGGLVGAGLALLLTPQPGSRTRQQIKEASEDTREKMGVYYRQAREKMGATVDRGRELMKESGPLLTAAIEAGREAYEREKEKAKAGA
ncbi:MAG: YtxH-like protein [Syntrophorhabdaceae bacterium PtaU1.Bin034]|nr:MAG: YtxH-like protein [Syntrophorhabdaceae bacterium PtaU1.Bin034]